MPVGDTRSEMRRIAAGAFLNVRPPAGEEWIIHNLWHGTAAELYLTNGTDSIRADVSTGEGAWLNYNFHVTNSLWIAIRNVSTAEALFGYDGIVSKG